MPRSLADIAASVSSPLESRLFCEYGAVFVTAATPPPGIIFSDAGQVREFQSSLAIRAARFGEWEIELQAPAMRALLEASSEMANRGGSITPRAADAGRRDYDDTVRLWDRNVTRGLDHWQSEGRLTAARAQSIRGLTPMDQVRAILEIEDSEQLYFGTYFDRSILHSVAAPGTSQHLSMLAFDVAEYSEATLEGVLNNFGWYRTVTSDLPHFTYLGYGEGELAGRGLKLVEQETSGISYRFWVPNIEVLR